MVHIRDLFCPLGSTTLVFQLPVVRCRGLSLQKLVSIIQAFPCLSKRHIGFRLEDESKRHLNSDYDELRV